MASKEPILNDEDDYEEIKVVAVDEPDDVINHSHVPHYSDQADFDKMFGDAEAEANRHSVHSAKVSIDFK
jgi:phosphoketolase